MWPASAASPSEMSSIARRDARRAAGPPRRGAAAARSRPSRNAAPAPPSGPVTTSRSPGRAPRAAGHALRAAERGHAEQHAVGAGRVAADAPARRPRSIPSYSSRRPRRRVSPAAPSETISASGSAPEAARSLTFTAAARKPSSRQRDPVEAEVDALDERVLRDDEAARRPRRRARSRVRGRAARARRAARTRPARRASQQLDPRAPVERVRVERGERVVQARRGSCPGPLRSRRGVLGGDAERRERLGRGLERLLRLRGEEAPGQRASTCSRCRSPPRAARGRSRPPAPARRRRRGRPGPVTDATTPSCAAATSASSDAAVSVPIDSTPRTSALAPTSVATSPAFPRRTVDLDPVEDPLRGRRCGSRSRRRRRDRARPEASARVAASPASSIDSTHGGDSVPMFSTSADGDAGHLLDLLRRVRHHRQRAERERRVRRLVHDDVVRDLVDERPALADHAQRGAGRDGHRATHSQDVDRAVAGADLDESVRDGARGRGCRAAGRVEQGLAAREQRRERGRMRAPGAVRRRRRRGARPGSRRAREPSKRWSTASSPWPPVTITAGGAELVQPLGELLPRRLDARERLRLGQVRRDHGREREQPRRRALHGVVLAAASRRSSRPSPGRRRAGRGAPRGTPATVSISRREKSIPVFAASTPMSSNTASSCATTNSGGSSWIGGHAQRVLRRQRDEHRRCRARPPRRTPSGRPGSRRLRRSRTSQSSTLGEHRLPSPA